MKYVAIGIHLLASDVTAVAAATPFPIATLTLSTCAIDDDQPVGDRDLLIRVAGIREQLLGVATFIAVRYGMTVANQADAAAKCAAFLPRWTTLLEQHRDHVEMTLKVPVEAAEPRPDRHDFSSGAAYLKALHHSRGSAAPEPSFARMAEELIGGAAVAWKWLPRDNASVELVALVQRDTLDTVREAGRQLRERAAGVPFLLSGPWPLEAFADDEH
jgi:Gas vesicle synthesis protein GvpL/GvpF